MNNPFPKIKVESYCWWYTRRTFGFKAETNFGTIHNDGIGDATYVHKDWTGPKGLTHRNLELILDYWVHTNPGKSGQRCSLCRGKLGIHSRRHTDGSTTCNLCASSGNPEGWYPFADEQ